MALPWCWPCPSGLCGDHCVPRAGTLLSASQGSALGAERLQLLILAAWGHSSPSPTSWSPSLDHLSHPATALPNQPKFLREVPAQGSPAKVAFAAKLQSSVPSCFVSCAAWKRVIIRLSSRLLLYFVDGEKMGISYSPFALKGENLFFSFPSFQPFIQINLWAEAKPGEISCKMMKFSEPNGGNYRGLESKLFCNFNKSRL